MNKKDFLSTSYIKKGEEMKGNEFNLNYASSASELCIKILHLVAWNFFKEF